MEMIRWLATNKVVLTVWGLGILAILLSLIFGGGNKTEQEVAVIEAAPVEVVADVATIEPAVATAPAVAASKVQAVVDTAVVSTDVAVTEATAEVESAVQVADATEAEVQEAETMAASDTSASTVVAALPETDDLSGKSSDDLLMMAREAYWDNGLDKAASLYAELITREPTVIEHKGELGNVFWRQGYPKKAAELYADIAQPMIEQGNGERVSNMVGFIGLFFPERASGIRQLLDAQ